MLISRRYDLSNHLNILHRISLEPSHNLSHLIDHYRKLERGISPV